MDDLETRYKNKIDKLKKEKKFEDALKIEDKIREIKNEERDEDFWYKRAIHCCELGEYEDAVECLEKDLTHHKKNYETYFLKGLVFHELEKFEDAIECYNKAVEERNQSFLEGNKKISYMKKAHKFEKALLYTDNVDNSKPLDENFWYHKGLAYFKLGRFLKAKDCFSNAIEVNKEDPKSLYFLAKCNLASGNDEKCVEILQKTCFLSSEYKIVLKFDQDLESLIHNKEFRILRGL